MPAEGTSHADRVGAASGLTLIELVVAIAIFSVIGTAAYSGLAAVLEARDRADMHAARLASVQRAIDTLADDLDHALARTVREANNEQSSALAGSADLQGGIGFTRGGWPNPAGLVQAEVVRVHWQLDGDRLVRHWRLFPDALDGTPHTRRAMLDDVDSAELRYLDREGQWQDSWPSDPGVHARPELPCAVHLRIELADWGRIERLFALADAAPNATGNTGCNGG